MNRIRTIPLLSLLLVGAFWSTACNENPVQPEPEEVEETPDPEDPEHPGNGIAALVTGVPKYDEAQTWPEREDSSSVTATGADTVTEGNVVTSTEWIEETKHYSASENPDEYMMYDPLASVLWPGNLVQGNSVASGVPNSIPIEDRAPGKIVLAIVSGDSAGSTNEFSRTIEHFRASDVIDAMNDILAGYEGGAPAKYSYSLEEVHSASQLNFDLGFGYSGPLAEVEGRFAFKKQDAQSRLAVRLTQQFYTMVFDDPEGPAGVFGPSVTAETLSPYTGDGNPITYISSVTYGRVYILLYESEASMDELEASLRFAYAGASGSSETEFSEVMSRTTVSILQIGGDPEAGLETGAGLAAPNMEKIRDFMTRGANFSANNPGAPISYTIKYLKDATLVRMNNTMEYSVVQRSPISSSTTYTNSEFNLLFKNLQIVDTTDPDGADSGLRVRVYTVDGSTGQTETIWNSKTPNDGVAYGVAWNVEETDGNAVQELPAVDWTVPAFELPDDPDLSLYIEFNGGEFDPPPDPSNPATGWQWAADTRRYIYDPVVHRWKVDEGTWDHTYVSPPEVTLKLTWELKRNGSVVTAG